ncbi:MAG: hypothetical protein II887_07305 [Bacteroidales bacterium]|nr:hypothetical protein [Bacteroidales bacterium]
MKHYIVPIALLACFLATSCNTNKRLYNTGVAYHQANQADHERIQQLKSSGNPDIWPEVFERYCSIKGRSDEMAHFPPEVRRSLNYVPLNIDDELNQARNKAEAYLTAKIGQTLNGENPNLDFADKLIKDLERVNRDNSQINDLKLKSLAKRHGDLSELMHLEMAQQYVTPNRDETVSFKETNNGKTVTVTDHNLSKSATIKGRVVFTDPRGRRIVLSYPYEVSSKFSYTYTTIEGDRGACSEQTLERLKQPLMPFPTDESMINDAKRQLMEIINQKIQ